MLTSDLNALLIMTPDSHQGGLCLYLFACIARKWFACIFGAEPDAVLKEVSSEVNY